jgi:beta-alanine--pyruvate transaminase
VEPVWAEALHELRGLPHVVDVRAMGLVGAVELAPRDGRVGARAFEVFTRCFAEGVLVRQTGDVIAMSPPLIVEEGHIGEIVATLARVLRALP